MKDVTASMLPSRAEVDAAIATNKREGQSLAAINRLVLREHLNGNSVTRLLLPEPEAIVAAIDSNAHERKRLLAIRRLVVSTDGPNSGSGRENPDERDSDDASGVSGADERPETPQTPDTGRRQAS